MVVAVGGCAQYVGPTWSCIGRGGEGRVGSGELFEPVPFNTGPAHRSFSPPPPLGVVVAVAAGGVHIACLAVLASAVLAMVAVVLVAVLAAVLCSIVARR